MKRILGWLCTVAPFVAAAIAALGARHDYRILWMAIAATVLVRIVVAATAPSRGLGFASVAGFASGSAGGMGVAVAAGARGIVGVVAVAVVIAAFATAGAVVQADVTNRSARLVAPKR